MKPTKKQIKQEIKKLKDLAPNIRRFSAFGTDNKATIDAQINVLENNLGDNDIYDNYDCAGVDEETLSGALDAKQWLEGEYGMDTLSEDWEGLRQ